MKDTVSTVAGGAAGLLLLQQVRWEAIPAPWSEITKIVVAFILFACGYLMYPVKVEKP